MRIALQPVDHLFVARLVTPDLGPAHVEPLIARQAFDDWGFFSLEGNLVGLVSDRQAGVVGDILAEGQLAVHVVSRKGAEGAILGDKPLGAHLEVPMVFLRPPVAQVALAVAGGALVVEAVPDLVADHRADRPVVHGVVGFEVEERRLEDRRGEHDLVHFGVVIRVHRLGRHSPLLTVDRLSEFVQFAHILELVRPEDVPDQIMSVDRERGIIAPLVRIPNLVGELRKLLLGRSFGLRAHPGQSVDALAIRLEQVLDEVFHAGLALGREIETNIYFSETLADGSFDEGNAALPPGPVLRLPGQDGPLEGEVLVDDRFREIRSEGAEQVPPEIRFPDRKGLGLQDLVERRQVARLADDDVVRPGGDARLEEIRAPIVAGRQGIDGLQFDAVVGLDRIAVFDLGPLGLGELGLENDDLARIRRRIRISGQGQHLFDVRLVFRAHFAQLLVFHLEIVIPVGKTEAVLHEVGDVFRRVLGILVNRKRIGGTCADPVQMGDQRRNFSLGPEGVDSGEFPLERLQPEFFELRLIHEAFIQITDLLQVGTRLLT
ncbi:MAG: hypothetical protein BWY66_01373 [bacterium ADurb.Bin374]|nr:MAG: hypothetical protein BWY66_01373 [bacterium ADurb.Bin374]